MDKKILVIGTFDSKGQEYEFLASEIKRLGAGVIGLDVGTFSEGLTGVDEIVAADEVIKAAGSHLGQVQNANDRGQAMKLMSEGAAVITRQLFDAERISGVVGMGGSGGSSVISAAMQVLPVGLPKVLLSTMAGGNTLAYVGAKDIVLIPSITDISGLNSISRTMIVNTAAAITGMAREYQKVDERVRGRKVIAVSMFGNTTECVNRCRELLDSELYEVIVFHSTGTGGRIMESLIADGYVDGCLDITTTELADEVCGGILSAGPDRLSAAGQKGIPHLVVPGCVDMANFGGAETVPETYRQADRLFYEWNPSITLMRTNIEENVRIGEMMVEHLNAADGPVKVLIPLNGVSILDGEGERFYDRMADQALFETLKAGLGDHIEVIEMDCNINDVEFADRAVKVFRNMMPTN